MTEKKLTQKQEDFCRKYVETGSKSEAYKAVYSTENQKPSSVHRNAVALSRLPHVQARIEKLLQERNENKELTDAVIRDRIIEGLYEIATDKKAPASARVSAWTMLAKKKGVQYFEASEDDSASTSDYKEDAKRLQQYLKSLKNDPAVAEAIKKSKAQEEKDKGKPPIH